MKKVAHKKDLPEWFDLEKYKGVESFGPKEWYWQLNRRKWLLFNNPEYPVPQSVTRSIPIKITYRDESGEVIQDGAIMDGKSVTLDTAVAMDYWRKRVREAAQESRDNPLACSPAEQIEDEYIARAQPVASMTMSDLRGVVRQENVSAIRNGTPTLQDYIDTDPCEFDKLLEDVRSRTIWYRPYLPFSFGSVTKAAVLVNLNASDHEIKESFETWLKEARASQQTGSKSRKLSCSDLAEYGVLPYLDLKIWSLETSIRISDQIMAEAVTPGRSTDDLRKTTKKYAKVLMIDLSELLASASAEE